MIGELAFTPSVFDEEANSDAETWRDQLRELGNAMFPKTAVSAVMVSNLYDSSWHEVARKTANAVKDSRSRILCENILNNMSKALVHRANANPDWPLDDLAWGREAAASSAIEPIDRIVSSRAVQDELVKEGLSIRCIDEVQASGFWREISSQWSQPLNLPSQISAIRKMAFHADFLCLITPHIRGSSDDETDFAIEMIRSSHARQHGRAMPEVEIHAEGPEGMGRADFNQRLQNCVHNTTRSLQSALGNGQSANLVLWPKLLDRYLIAGVVTETSSGGRVRSPRWGISMQHIARRADNRETKPPTSWSLMPPDQLGDEFERYCVRRGKALHSAVIVGT